MPSQLESLLLDSGFCPQLPICTFCGQTIFPACPLIERISFLEEDKFYHILCLQKNAQNSLWDEEVELRLKEVFPKIREETIWSLIYS